MAHPKRQGKTRTAKRRTHDKGCHSNNGYLPELRRMAYLSHCMWRMQVTTEVS